MEYLFIGISIFVNFKLSAILYDAIKEIKIEIQDLKSGKAKNKGDL